MKFMHFDDLLYRIQANRGGRAEENIKYTFTWKKTEVKISAKMSAEGLFRKKHNILLHLIE